MINNSLSNDYNKDKEYSLNDPISYWDYVARQIKWDKMYEKVYSGDEYKPDWFNGGKLNVCYNVLDVYANDEKTKDQLAFVHECPLFNIVNKLTYHQLWNKVCIFSRALTNLGIEKGDTVMIFMPTTMEAFIAMLSCSRLGAIHCNVHCGFSYENLSIRIDQLKPVLLITSNCSVKNYDIIKFGNIVKTALDLSTFKPNNIIVNNRKDLIPQINDEQISGSLDWDEITNELEPLIDYTSVESNHPLFVSFTSGTTGTPKCLSFESSGFLMKTKLRMHHVVGAFKRATIFSTSDVGWSVSQMVNVFGCLSVGATSINFEGDPTIPHPNNFFKLVEKYNVNVLFIVPTEVRLIKNKDINGDMLKQLNLSSLKCCSLIGEAMDSSVEQYLKNAGINNLVNGYGQTETGGGIITNYSKSFPKRQYSIGKPMIGINIVLLNENGQPITKPNEFGEITIKLPLPPSFSNSFYKNQQGFNNHYLKKYPGYYNTNDIGYFDNDGYYFLKSRSDDVVKICGEKVFCLSCEEIIQKHENILDSVVVGIDDTIYNQRVIGFVILKNIDSNDINSIELIHDEINKNIQDKNGEFSKLKYLIPISSIPRNRNNKKIRNLLLKIFNQQEYTIPPTLSNIDDLKQIEIEIKNFKENLSSTLNYYSKNDILTFQI